MGVSFKQAAAQPRLSVGSLLAATAIAALAISAEPASAVTLYSNNFDGAASVDAGVSASLTGVTLQSATVGAWNAAGWSGSYADNRTGGSPQGTASGFTSLSLSSLAPHTTVSMNFVLGFLESWDSSDGGAAFAPDSLELFIDGVMVGQMTTNNALGTIEDYDGGTELFENVQVNGFTYYNDTLVNAGTATWATFAHTAPTLTIALRATGAGWQGGTDEGFGIDSVTIAYDGVRPPPTTGAIPEPSAWALMIVGMGGAGAMLRRRRLVRT